MKGTSWRSSELRLVGAALALFACGHSSSSSGGGGGAAPDAEAADVTPSPSASTASTEAPDAESDAGAKDKDKDKDKETSDDFAAWLRARVPKSAKVVSEGGTVKVLHTVDAADTPLTIAKSYLDVTDVYYAKDLAAQIQKQSQGLSAGKEIAIPSLLKQPYPEPDKDRLGWPDDKVMRGVFITGAFAALYWPDIIEKVAARRPLFNSIVLDGKDYDGPVNYPTKAKIAVEIEATPKDPPIPDLARAIRWAHARGVRIILRVPCFHDPLAAKKAKRISLQGIGGYAMTGMGWLDPTNDEAVAYVLELVNEGVAAGADEIQLDYIRFPVVGPVKAMKLPPPRDGERITRIRDIVRKVHEVTSAKGVPLSLDIFGVTATGDRSDWEALGQDISVLGAECEALSPMVYPSHYDKGFRGFAEPGAHPEVIGIGTKAAVKYLQTAKPKPRAVIRSWLQAFGWHAPNYGPKYLVEETRQAEANGGTGWLMWSPGNDYYAAWVGFPVPDQGSGKEAKREK
jgi:hypothetical protein